MRLLISGYYGFGNVGDEAILAATVPLLRERWPQAEICVLSADPTQTTQAYGVEAVERWSRRAIWKELRRADLLISGGGGLLQDTTSWRSPLYYLGILRLARMARTPYVIFAQGLGPLNHWTSRLGTRRCLSRAAAITLRDNPSAELARAIGVRGDIEVTADPALLLEPASPARVEELLEEAAVVPGRPLVGVTLRDWPQVEPVVEALLPLLRTAHKDWDAELLLLPFQSPGDEALNWRLARDSGVPARIMRHLPDPRDALGIISRLQLYVTMRLHGLIFAAARQTPALGLAYDPKLTSFARRAEQPVFGLEELADGRMIEAAQELFSRPEDTAVLRQRAAQQLRQEALQSFEALQRVVAELKLA